MKFDTLSLINWFKRSKRDLPWRTDVPNPYHVWVSEIMLQQTQVSVVIPYFLRWMKKFPSIEKLAEATEEEVIKCWEGLGYYSRARNLHAGARFIMDNFNGEIPCEEEELKKIKGLGPYTVGAIRSFAFHQKTSAVDGNVVRVLSRYFLIEDDVTSPKVMQSIRAHADAVIPEEESWVFNEGLIELGALICTKSPKCVQCPVNETCKAFHAQRAEELPYKKKKTKIEYLYRGVAVIHCDGHYLLRKGNEGEVMNGLHEFPYIDSMETDVSSHQTKTDLEELLQMELHLVSPLNTVNHSFTKYRVQLFPYLFKTSGMHDTAHYKWISIQEMETLAFSSGHRRILKQLNLSAT